MGINVVGCYCYVSDFDKLQIIYFFLDNELSFRFRVTYACVWKIIFLQRSHSVLSLSIFHLFTLIDNGHKYILLKEIIAIIVISTHFFVIYISSLYLIAIFVAHKIGMHTPSRRRIVSPAFVDNFARFNSALTLRCYSSLSLSISFNAVLRAAII